MNDETYENDDPEFQRQTVGFTPVWKATCVCGQELERRRVTEEPTDRQIFCDPGVSQVRDNRAYRGCGRPDLSDQGKDNATWQQVEHATEDTCTCTICGATASLVHCSDDMHDDIADCPNCGRVLRPRYLGKQ